MQHYIWNHNPQCFAILFPGKQNLNLDIWSRVFGRKLGVGENVVKKLRLSWTRALPSGILNQRKVRELNVQRREERQKDDMQGPLGRLDSHENEITILLLILQLLSLSNDCSKSRNMFEETFTGFLNLCYVSYGWVGHSCMKLSWSIGNAMLHCYNHLIQTWNGDKV